MTEDEKKEHHILHSMQRCRERYGIELTRQDYAQIIQLIRDKQTELGWSKFLHRFSAAKSAHHVKWNTTEFLVIYHKKRKRIVTFLPWEDVDVINQKAPRWAGDKTEIVYSIFRALEHKCRRQYKDLGNRKRNALYYKQNCIIPGVCMRMYLGRDYYELIWARTKLLFKKRYGIKNLKTAKSSKFTFKT